MAVTLTALQPEGRGFAVNAYSADFSGCEVIQAAPGAGLFLVLTHLFIHCVAAITVTVGEGETSSAVDDPIVGPLTFAATSGAPVEMFFNPGIVLTANKALTVDASGAGAAVVVAQGFTK